MRYYISEKYHDLAAIAENHSQEYQTASPFANIYFKDFFNPDMLAKVLEEFPDLSNKDAIKFDNPNEKKLGGKGERPFGEVTKGFMHFLNSEPFLAFLQQLTGIQEPLIGDPYFVGGGLHEIKKGGLLKIHADFNKHPVLKLDRRINALVYLNKDWSEEYGGHFELWDKTMSHCEKKILPEFNTLAIFSTTSHSYHGHPNPLNCPDHRSRKSLALYYYSNGRPKEEVDEGLGQHSTIFKAREGHNEEQEINHDKKPASPMKQFVKDLIPPILFKALRK